MRQVTTRDPAWRFYGALAIAIIGTLSILLWVASAAASQEHKIHKSYVCKYVGTPGVDERLQTGQNPIYVDNHSLAPGTANNDTYVGEEFSDAQGKSVVIVANTAKLDPEPDVSQCPAPIGPPPCEGDDCPPPPCTEDCPPPPCEQDCPPPPCTTDCGPPPCETDDCGPVPCTDECIVPPPHHHHHPQVPPSPTIKQYVQDVTHGADTGGG